MLLTLAAVTAGSVGAAAAKDLRYPESGPVAFQLHLPDSWTARVGKSGSMLVIEPDGSAAISLTLMREDSSSLAKTPDELANTLLVAAKAEPFNKHEKGVIGGVPADSYYSRLVRAANGPQLMKINMIKSLHGYIVLETIMTAATIDSTQQTALNAALKGIRLIGAASSPTPPKGPTNPSSAEVSSNPARTDGPSFLADGSTVPTNTFVIRSLQVGDILIENVTGSVSPAAGSLLLGQSFLQRFKSRSMDNNILEQ
jgi:hypothetical protein